MNPEALDATKDLKINRMSAKEADYMELDGAKKDADCEKVEVKGGVSSDLGCCNEFDPESGASEFRCGECEYLTPKQMANLDHALKGLSKPGTGKPKKIVPLKGGAKVKK